METGTQPLTSPALTTAPGAGALRAGRGLNHGPAAFLATIFGSKLASRSRGTESSTSPASVITVFAR
jgi:hypothetical protein